MPISVVDDLGVSVDSVVLCDGKVGLVGGLGVFSVSVFVEEIGGLVVGPVGGFVVDPDDGLVGGLVTFDEVDSVTSEVVDVTVLDAVLGPCGVVLRVLVV